MSERTYSVSVSQQGKNILVAYALWFFLGGFGIHRFYLGKPKTGLFQLILLAFGFATSFILIGLIPLLILAIWWIVDAYFVWKYVEEANQNHPHSSSILTLNTQDARSNDLDELGKLHDLHKRGALTAEEYNQRKTALMDRHIVPRR